MIFDPQQHPRQAYVVTMARYNAWMNDKVYRAAARLPESELMRERGAFFGSLFGTLSHVVVADTVWLKRFASDPSQPAHAQVLAQFSGLAMPARLDAHPYADLQALATRRHELDRVIQRWAADLDEAALAAPLAYQNMQGEPLSRELFAALMHFFNHQTHHRGQATTLLTQAGEDVGATDLVAMPLPA